MSHAFQRLQLSCKKNETFSSITEDSYVHVHVLIMIIVRSRMILAHVGNEHSCTAETFGRIYLFIGKSRILENSVVAGVALVVTDRSVD